MAILAKILAKAFQKERRMPSDTRVRGRGLEDLHPGSDTQESAGFEGAQRPIGPDSDGAEGPSGEDLATTAASAVASRVRARLPSHAAIAAAQGAIVARRGISPSEAASTCWGCKHADRGWRPDRAHIVARARGCSDKPENLLLLCALCHREQPDGAPIEAQLAWLDRRESFFARADREWDAPVRSAIEAARAEVGDAALEAFIAQTSMAEVNRILRAGAGQAAATNPHTRAANALEALRARIVDTFRTTCLAPDRPARATFDGLSAIAAGAR